MPVKYRIRNSANRSEKQSGLIQGKIPHREHNAHKVLRKWPYCRAVLLWFSAMGVILLALATIGYGIYEKQQQFISIGIGLFIFWLFLKLMYFLACKATTCPLCRAPHLQNGKSNKHKKAYKIFPFSYSSTAILTTLFNRCVRCMHCGVTFDLTKKYR